ncbi:Protein CBG28111 [Caenorhabditis briggsae]|uniref:Protein CBG28111 n=1 Tax=Caenorhabditis briggsae TaxID=6238 RepID=B6IGV0_CAEBR|nr:Protein CBG28111 [Caenorhabditis briggsae]CAR99130.1 Protein CBG28111 [Caenorhabditis briggsae]
MSCNQQPNTSPDGDLLLKILRSIFAKGSDQDDETEFVLPNEVNVTELLKHIVDFMKPTTENLIDQPLDLSPPVKRARVQQSSSVIFRAPEVPSINLSELETNNSRIGTLQDQGFPFSLKSVAQKTPKVYIDRLGIPRLQMTERQSSVSGIQKPSKSVLSVPKLSVTSPISSEIGTAAADKNSNIATTSSSSSASPIAVPSKSPVVFLDQVGMTQIYMMEPSTTYSGMQENAEPVSKANVPVPAKNNSSPEKAELVPTTIPLAATIILDPLEMANLKVKKPERSGEGMNQNKKCTPITNPATTPASPTSNAKPSTAPSSSTPNTNLVPSSSTSQNQSEEPAPGTQAVPSHAPKAVVSKPNTISEMPHQMQRGPEMQGNLYNMNFVVHPAHLPYPAIPGLMGYPGFVPPMMFPPHPHMPAHVIVPSPVSTTSDVFQPADEVLQYLLNDLKDEQMIKRLKNLPEPQPEAFWTYLREETVGKTKVIEDLASKFSRDFCNCSYMSQARAEIIGAKYGVNRQVVCSAYARYRFCYRRSNHFSVQRKISMRGLSLREKLNRFHWSILRKSLMLLWSGESAENVLAELRLADDPFPLIGILEAERKKDINATMYSYKERLLKLSKKDIRLLLDWAFKEPSAEEVNNDDNVPFELIRVVRLLIHFKSYKAVTEHLMENPSSLLLPNVISNSIVKKEPLDEQPDVEQYTQFIRNYYKLSSVNLDNSRSQQLSATMNN